MISQSDGFALPTPEINSRKSLPLATLVNRVEEAHFSLNLYPEAREGGGTFVPVRPYRRGGGTKGHAVDPERSAEEAARRARAKIRRYCATHQLNRLGTLTFRGEGCHDQRQLRAYVGEFFRQLRLGLGDKPSPTSGCQSGTPPTTDCMCTLRSVSTSEGH